MTEKKRENESLETFKKIFRRTSQDWKAGERNEREIIHFNY